MKFIFVGFFIGLSYWASSQNLVKNYSFEEGAVCDGTTEGIKKVDYWSALAGNPKFINVNCPLSKDSRSYVQGMRLPPASEGSVLAGIGVATKGEYLQGHLISTLQKDVSYIIKVRVRLPVKFCNTFINEIGILLHSDSLAATKEYRNIEAEALLLKNNTKTAIQSQYNWEELSVLYTAKGDEKYISIGNFSNTNVGLWDKRSKKECTYLFLDVVSVEAFKEAALEAFNVNSPLKQNASYWLKNISFEKESATLKNSSSKALKELGSLLIKNTALTIELSSHINNTLDATSSKNLTVARAEMLVNTLVNMGVTPSQVVAVGRGSAKAIALNSTEEGRKKNERIELKIIGL